MGLGCIMWVFSKSPKIRQSIFQFFIEKIQKTYSPLNKDAKLLIHKKTTHQNVLHVFKQKKLQHRKRGGVRLEIRERYCSTTLSRPNLIKRVSGGDGIFKLCWKRISDLGHGTETSTLARFLILFFGLSSSTLWCCYLGGWYRILRMVEHTY